MSDERFEAMLRKSMRGPVPRLGPGFERRVMRGVERQSRPMSRVGWMVLACYGLSSVFTCGVVMLGQRIDGWATTATVLGSTLITAGLLCVVQKIRVRRAR